MQWKTVGRAVTAVILVMAVYAVVNILSVRGQLARAEDYRSQLATEILVLTKENKRLEREIAAAEDEDVIRRIAGRKLGLVMPGELIFIERNGQ